MVHAFSFTSAVARPPTVRLARSRAASKQGPVTCKWVLKPAKSSRRTLVLSDDEKFSVTVGRDNESADAVAPYDTVSSTHAEFSMDGGRCFITDLNSTNGTYVNGQDLSRMRRRRMQIQDGDTVELGGEEFLFTEEQSKGGLLGRLGGLSGKVPKVAIPKGVPKVDVPINVDPEKVDQVKDTAAAVGTALGIGAAKLLAGTTEAILDTMLEGERKSRERAAAAAAEAEAGGDGEVGERARADEAVAKAREAMASMDEKAAAREEKKAAAAVAAAEKEIEAAAKLEKEAAAKDEKEAKEAAAKEEREAAAAAKLEKAAAAKKEREEKAAASKKEREEKVAAAKKAKEEKAAAAKKEREEKAAAAKKAKEPKVTRGPNDETTYTFKSGKGPAAVTVDFERDMEDMESEQDAD